MMWFFFNVKFHTAYIRGTVMIDGTTVVVHISNTFVDGATITALFTNTVVEV